MNEMTMPGRQIGRSLPRLEARDKVTGRTEYVHNLRLPGMLYGKIFRSTVAHGRIRNIDVSAARAHAGVAHVITGEDVRKIIPRPFYGPAFHDQPVLALDKVHYVGEPVAVVLATDPYVADEAVQLISAEYDELPAVFDEVEAMTSQAIVHDELKPAGTFPDLKHLQGRRNTNVALDFHLRRGDVDKAFATADRVFEHTFRTQQVLHLPLEPFVSVAEPTGSGITIHTASQSPSFVRIEIARLLGWPENRVRVKVPYLGGGFGAKLYIKLEAMVTALALLVQRPVKVALTMEEQFYTLTKHASTFRIKSAVNKDGRITARHCEVWWNGGAYADIGPRITQKSGFTAPGPYDIDNVSINSYSLYTNLPPAGALRGFGIPQLVWAYESHADMIARELALDPVEFRRRNILREGRPQATGTLMRDAAIEAVLERLAERLELGQAFRSRQRHGKTRARARDRLQGIDLADHLHRDRQRGGRWQRDALLQHGRYGSGFGYGQRASGRRSTRRGGGVGADRSSGHRRHALRHGDAWIALHVPHGQCGAARRAGRQSEARSARRRTRLAAGVQHSAARSCFAANTACRLAMSSASAATCRPMNPPTTTPGRPATRRPTG